MNPGRITVDHQIMGGVPCVTGLVEDLVEISRFDAGTAKLVPDDTDIAAAVGRCLRARGWTNVRADVPSGVTARLDPAASTSSWPTWSATPCAMAPRQ